jgi:hypothetical protein
MTNYTGAGAISDLAINLDGDSMETSNSGLRIKSGAVVGTTNETDVTYSNGVHTVGLPNDVTIGQDLIVTRNLTVNGDQFKVDGETVVMNDTLMEMGTVGSSNAAPSSATTKDLGLLMHRHDGVGARLQFMGWDEADDKFKMLSAVTDDGDGTISGGSAAPLEVGALTAAATGVSTLSTSDLATLHSVAVTGTTSLNGNVFLGNSPDDNVTPNGKFAGDLLPNSGARKLGAPGTPWQELHIAGEAVIDDIKLDAKTISVLDGGPNADLTLAPKGTGSVVMSKVDINGGAIDDTPIAGASGAFTTLSCNDKALAAGALNINSEPSITLAANDVFAVSDDDASNEIKKTSMADIQAYLANNASAKAIGTITGAGVAAGALANNVNAFPNLDALGGLLADVNGASASVAKSEVYLNGMLLSRAADGDYSGSATLVEDYGYDTDAAAGSPAPGLIFLFDLVAGDHIAVMARS